MKIQFQFCFITELCKKIASLGWSVLISHVTHSLKEKKFFLQNMRHTTTKTKFWSVTLVSYISSALCAMNDDGSRRQT